MNLPLKLPASLRLAGSLTSLTNCSAAKPPQHVPATGQVHKASRIASHELALPMLRTRPALAPVGGHRRRSSRNTQGRSPVRGIGSRACVGAAMSLEPSGAF